MCTYYMTQSTCLLVGGERGSGNTETKTLFGCSVDAKQETSNLSLTETPIPQYPSKLNTPPIK